jgi:hypothetical protein
MMKTKLRFPLVQWLSALALALSAALLLAPGVLAKNPKLFLEPQYDPATIVELEGKVVAIRETPAIDAMAGIHVILKTSMDSVDVYLGPARFIKMLNFKVEPGDKLEVIGSEIVYIDGDVVLAREVKKGAVSLTLRDDSGEPVWKDWMED